MSISFHNCIVIPMSEQELSESDVRQLIKEALRVQRGEASCIIMMKKAKGRGVFVKAAEIHFNPDAIAANLNSQLSYS